MLLVTALHVLCGCNNEDDVVEIFTGKTWKLSKISAEGTNIQFNYWPNDNANGDAFKQSMDLLRGSGNFTITFSGGEINGITGGTFNGRGVNATFSGKWQADGATHEMSMETNVSGMESNVLSKAFISGLQNVIRYEGDANNLFIYFKDGKNVKYMGFTPQR